MSLLYLLYQCQENLEKHVEPIYLYTISLVSVLFKLMLFTSSKYSTNHFNDIKISILQNLM